LLGTPFVVRMMMCYMYSFIAYVLRPLEKTKHKIVYTISSNIK